ncbi:hypothetical protein OF83DRAFT_788045 [Amylostereum chailletii]|nr:hypothetical protein OF83DRAFT_788045 [Amylostereum chailletii]
MWAERSKDTCGTQSPRPSRIPIAWSGRWDPAGSPPKISSSSGSFTFPLGVGCRCSSYRAASVVSKTGSEASPLSPIAIEFWLFRGVPPVVCPCRCRSCSMSRDVGWGASASEHRRGRGRYLKDRGYLGGDGGRWSLAFYVYYAASAFYQGRRGGVGSRYWAGLHPCISCKKYNSGRDISPSMASYMFSTFYGRSRTTIYWARPPCTCTRILLYYVRVTTPASSGSPAVWVNHLQGLSYLGFLISARRETDRPTRGTPSNRRCLFKRFPIVGEEIPNSIGASISSKRLERY